MLEEQIKRMKWGIEFIDLGVESKLNPEKPPIDPQHYATRAEGINERTSSWEGLGIVVGIAKNAVIHPKTMYDLYRKKK